jgi:S-DNA-T family DNA segregation ATPase FtsK/SpoIIIE
MDFTSERKSELAGFLWLGLAVILGLSLVPREPNLMGEVGRVLFRVFFGAFGWGGFAVALYLGAWGLSQMFRREVHAPTVKVAGGALSLLAVLTLIHLFTGRPVASGVAEGLYHGGIVGKSFCYLLVRYVSPVGTVVCSLIMLGVSLYLLGQEDLVKNTCLRLYERAKIALQMANARLGVARAEIEEGDTEDEKPARARKARAAATEVMEEEDRDEGRGMRDEKKAKGKAAVAELVKDEEEDDEEPAGTPERVMTMEDRQRAAEAFLKSRQSIKLSAGGPRINESASSPAVTSADQAQEQAPTELKDYMLPPVDLLKEGTKAGQAAPSDYQAVSSTLERALGSFGVTAKVVEVCVGPSVTRYELALAPGVKMARVVTLADDIALAAKVGNVRIEGPIQGKGTLGVEIPNAKSHPVLLRELVETEEFSQAAHKLVFAVGKDIGGSMVFSNLAEMPHLLVAGATGSGKSVCINAIVCSILLRAAPDEVKFLMVDPKRVELTPFDRIPHLLRPVVTNPKEAASALRLLVSRMEERYKLLASVGMRKIDDYNAWVLQRDKEKEGLAAIPKDELKEIPRDNPRDQHRRLPYIVVVIDELADLMMVSANEVENSVARLAQLARGVGIHLVIATQRPSVDVITGVIKANFPSRIAFQVSSKVDSRTILDSSGADALLGKGDMLYSPFNVTKPVRVQGCFVSNGEVEKIVNYLKKQAVPVYDAEFEHISQQAEARAGGEAGGSDAGEEDPLYEDAVRSVLNAGQASTSVLQRRLRIGYGRAARLLDLMEQEGVIGPPDGNRPRKVLLNPEDYSDDVLAVSTAPGNDQEK